MQSRIIAIANQKGGVGKTTTTANLAHAFMSQGKRVLAIDLDPQASLSISLGLDPVELRQMEDANQTIYFGMVKGCPLQDMIVAGDAKGRPDLVPASIRLSAAEAEMLSPYGAAHVLRDRLDELPTPYDVILIDCPPTLGILTVNGLSAAAEVLIPAKTDLLSIMGVPLLLDTIVNIQRRANPALRILGVLPTLYHPRNTHDKEVLDELTATMAAQGITVFEPVHHSTAFDKAVAEGRSALELWPQTPGVQTYQRIVEHSLPYDPQL
jgi:chromosome partitioning protein